jgi:Protein ChrB, N-terminal
MMDECVSVSRTCVLHGDAFSWGKVARPPWRRFPPLFPLLSNCARGKEKELAELDKLTRWLPKSEARDCFSAKLGPKARTALKACTADFNRYCKEVSDREVPPDSENLAPIPSKKRR